MKTITSLPFVAVGLLALAAATSVACSDDTLPAAPADGGATEASTSNTDAGGQDASEAGTGTLPGVIHFIAEVAPQPATGVPQFVTGLQTTSYPGAAEAGIWGQKPVALNLPGTVPGLGCQAALADSFGSVPDEGALTLSGFTGGTSANGPVTSPAACNRAMNAKTTFFEYTCPSFENIPSNEFIANTDKLKLVAAGGADIGAFTVEQPVPSYKAISVTNNLYGLTPADLDGSKDLTVNYTCDGGGCEQATLIAVRIEVTDQAVDPANPFAFPVPATGAAFCVQFAAIDSNATTVPKAVLGVLPKTWKRARALAAVLNANQAFTTAQNPVTLAVGVAQFGITNLP